MQGPQILQTPRSPQTPQTPHPLLPPHPQIVTEEVPCCCCCECPAKPIAIAILLVDLFVFVASFLNFALYFTIEVAIVYGIVYDRDEGYPYGVWGGPILIAKGIIAAIIGLYRADVSVVSRVYSIFRLILCVLYILTGGFILYLYFGPLCQKFCHGLTSVLVQGIIMGFGGIHILSTSCILYNAVAINTYALKRQAAAQNPPVGPVLNQNTEQIPVIETPGNPGPGPYQMGSSGQPNPYMVANPGQYPPYYGQPNQMMYPNFGQPVYGPLNPAIGHNTDQGNLGNLDAPRKQNQIPNAV